jgi:DNA-binding Lrp family transcriptional regulator
MELTVIPKPNLPERLEISQEWIRERNNLLVQAEAIQAVACQSDYQQAEIMLKLVTGTSNDAEKIRKKLSDPFNKVAKDIKKMADDARNPLETEKARIKSLMAEYIEETERKQREQMEAKAQEALASVAVDDPFADLAATSAFNEIAPETNDVKRFMSAAVKVWKFEIVEPMDVPREFLMPNEQKIREYVNANKDAAAIPGVRTWEETSIRSR